MSEVERAIRRARVALLQATGAERDAALRAVAELDAVLAAMNDETPPPSPPKR